MKVSIYFTIFFTSFWTSRSSTLVCPDGYQQVGRLNSGVAGCGLDGCMPSRYDYATIEDCAAECTRRRRRACSRRKKCRSFTFAPVGGDKRALTKSVCQFYNMARTNRRTRGPNQIMCKPLKCPRGSKKIIKGANGENDISGGNVVSGIQTIQQCARRCSKRDTCEAYSFAADTGSKTCTLYADDEPNATTNDNQVLCDKPCELANIRWRKGVVSGDPHFIMWNGERHHYQGNQHSSEQTYYLVTNCDINDRKRMPFSILGEFRSFGGRPFTGLDYITFVLYTGPNPEDEIYVYLSYEIREYVANGPGVSQNYDKNKENGVAMIPYGTGETVINDKFTIIVEEPRRNTVTLTLSIDRNVDDSCKCRDPCNVDVTFVRNVRRFNSELGRTLMNKLYVDPPECYRCYICGLLGDFQTPHKKSELIGCKGDRIILNTNGRGIARWRPSAKAFEESGLTWQKKYVANNCVEPEGGGNGGQGATECPDNIRQIIEPKLQEARDMLETCCRNIGGKFCDRRQSEAEIDICIACTDNPDDIDDEIKSEFTEKVLDECQDKGAFGPVPKLLYEFQGDLKETISEKTKYELVVNGNANNDAYVLSGVLNCDGNEDYVLSKENLDFGISSHSLEVLVQVTNLNSIGGGTIAIDSKYTATASGNIAPGNGYSHGQFDSIVYNEMNNKKFFLGSEYFKRTDKFGDKSKELKNKDGDASEYDPSKYVAEDTANEFVQLVATYNVESGRAKLYRNNVLQLEFEPDSGFLEGDEDEGYRIMFCQRHLAAGSNDFAGQIRYGAYYDYALSAKDVEILYESKIEGQFEVMGNELRANDNPLTEGQGLRSLNGEYIAVMESGGNFKVYSIDDADPANVQYADLGSTAGAPPTGYNRLIMGERGNLRAFDGNKNVIWESATRQSAALPGKASFDNIMNYYNNIHTSLPSTTTTTSMWTYLIYAIGILLIINCICIAINCYNTNKCNKTKPKYAKIVVPSTDADTDQEFLE